MKIIITIMALLASVVFIGGAMAVPPGKTLEFAGGDKGKVVFVGKEHAEKGLKCKDCHPAIFPMKGPGKEGTAKITMADIKAGKYCGTCHNGEKAFKASNEANCGKCHKK